MAQPNWQYSAALGTNFYRDDNGMVHYGDGTTGQATQTWQDPSGRTVYAANSAGPASTAGGAYQMAPMNQPTAGDNWNMTTGNNAMGGGASFGGGFSTGNNAASASDMAGYGGGASFGGGAVNPAAVGNISSYTAGQNPYLQAMGNAAVQQNTQNLQRNVLPGIASQAIASGGFGGSRQGVVEANALSDLNTANANALAGLAGNAYGQALNYDVARRSQDQQYGLGLGNLGLGYQNSNNSYNLGLGNLALGNKTADQNFALGGYNAANNYDLGLRNNQLGYFNGANAANNAQGQLGLAYANLDRTINNDNRANQQQGFQNTLALWNMINNNNQGGISAGTNINNTPLNYWNNLSNGANSIGQGYGTTTGSSSTQGNTALGALGGAQLGSSLFGGSSSFDPFGSISF